MKNKIDARLNSILRLLGSDWGKVWIVSFPCFVFLLLLMVFSRGYIILGSEGNYITDFQLIREVASSSWIPHIQGIGFPSSSLNSLAGIFDFFSFLQKIGLSMKAINIISVWLAYVLPFLSMMWLLSRVLRVRFFTAYIISLFYVLNPFSTYHLQSMMFWNIAPLFVLPLIFGCLYRYYSDTVRLFLFFGILTALFAFSFSNIPYLGVFHIFLVISIIAIPFIQDVQWKLKTVLRNFFVVELSFILFNAWWFINLIRFQIQDLALYYTKGFAVSWVREYSTGVDVIMGKLFSLKTLISSEKGDYFSDFYNSIPMVIILFIPFFLIFFDFLTKTGDQNNKNKKFVIAALVPVLLVLFLNKGASEPLGSIYVWMMAHIPFFYIFKTPLEKFSVLSVFLLALALIPIFRNTKSGWRYGIFLVYLAACSIPYFTLNFMPEYEFQADSKTHPGKYISKKYLYKEELLNAVKSLNDDRLDYRALSLPGSANYQTTILNHDGNKYYRGMDPFIFSVNKPFITAYFDPLPGFFDPLFNNLSNDSAEELFNIYSVRKIVFNRDIYPSFGAFRENKQAKKPIPDVLADTYEKSSFGSVDIFSRKDFLPHLYLPQSVTLSFASADKLQEIVSAPDYRTRSAVYFLNQNNSSTNARVKVLAGESVGKPASDLSVLEYKKISPVKYRMVIHRVRGEFPLVFSEKFHTGWKLYPADATPAASSQQILNDYKILDGNEEDQASKDELEDYIGQGFISTLGTGEEKTAQHWRNEDNARTSGYTEKYAVDFISKNFHGTIQNDNLPTGAFYETWFQKPIGNNDTHATANGYANSWLLNAENICANNSLCHQNADGTYDVEIVMEFWPERLYYLGGIISIATLIFCLAGMGFLRIRNGNKNASAIVTEVSNSGRIE